MRGVTCGTCCSGWDSRSARKAAITTFESTGIVERLNLQRSGSTAKPYQVKQVRNVILKYKLEDSSDAPKSSSIGATRTACLLQKCLNFPAASRMATAMSRRYAL